MVLSRGCARTDGSLFDYEVRREKRRLCDHRPSGTPDKEVACSSFDPTVNVAIVTCPAMLRTR
jgi:hypothetical protein